MGAYSNPSVVSRLRRLLAGQDTDRVSDRSASIVSRKRKQAQVRLGPDEVAALVQAYQAGSTLEEVAAKFGVYVRTAAAHLEREGIAQ
jgi:DNA-directed RNA polymerase specialized sigma24 family protein